MRRLMIVIVLATLVAGQAWSQDAPKRRRVTVIPPSAAGQPIDPLSPAAPAISGVVKPGAAVLPRSIARLTKPAPAPGASQCRAQCAQTRYACTAQTSEGDGGDCSTAWGQCVVGCGGDAYRYSDTSPRVFTPGFGPR